MAEPNTDKRSELEDLLIKNAYGPGLTAAEYRRARELIANPVVSQNDCWICKMSCALEVGKAIFDTRLCPRHAQTALNLRR